ncbi:MAG: glycoside hydrolase family 20 zincin-like fold domain-containing protein [Victivallaceae bacterium]|nr:glycoside hydrolase family 20 zincin-like fold domain-containing protein [Victivallaceae bacterium]
MRRILTILATAAAFAAAANELSLTPAGGLKIHSELCDLSLGSRIIAVDPSWTTRYFMSMIHSTASKPAGSSVEMVQNSPGKFELIKYSAEAADDHNQIKIELSARMTEDLPAELEYTILCIPEYLLTGAKYEFYGSDDDQQRISDTIGDPHSEIYTYGHDLRRAVFHSDLGHLVIEVENGPGFNITDRRGNTFMDNKCFWVGFSKRFDGTKPIDSVITVTFNPPKRLKLAVPLPAVEAPKTRLIPEDELVRGISPAQLPLLPTPYKGSLTGGTYAPAGNTELECAISDERLPRAIKRIFGDASLGRISIKQNANLGEEAYTLDVNAGGIAITAGSARGAFYGLQTLRRLFKDGAFLCASIEDHPDLAFRGIHLCMDAASNTYPELVEKVFAPMKINAIVGEVEYVKWKATEHLGIHQPRGMTPEQLADFVKLCDDNFIEFVPLLQTLGHSEWLFKNGKNLDMCEDPSHPYAYNVSNPKVYPLMNEILDELFSIKNFRYLHIGHDEVTLEGTFPSRPENIRRGMRNIVFEDVMFYYEYAKNRNCRIMMWHDMFMTPQESRTAFGGPPNNLAELRQQFPRDIIFCLWRYDGDTHPEIKILHDDGYQVIGCAWYDIGNPESHAQAILAAGELGALVTTWAGYFDSDKLLTVNFNQVEPYVRGACWFWRAIPAANQYNFHRILCDLLAAPRDPVPPQSGFEVDISDVANLSLDNRAAPFMKRPSRGLDELPKSDYYGAVRFEIPQRNDKNAAIAFRSRLNPQFPAEEVTVPVDNAKANRVFVLSTTIGTAKIGSRLGTVTLHYADGTDYEYPILYGCDAAPTNGEYNAKLNNINVRTWRWNRMEQRIWYADIVNPQPDKEIASIGLKGSDDGQPYYVLGLSLESQLKSK